MFKQDKDTALLFCALATRNSHLNSVKTNLQAINASGLFYENDFHEDNRASFMQWFGVINKINEWLLDENVDLSYGDKKFKLSTRFIQLATYYNLRYENLAVLDVGLVYRITSINTLGFTTWPEVKDRIKQWSSQLSNEFKQENKNPQDYLEQFASGHEMTTEEIIKYCRSLADYLEEGLKQYPSDFSDTKTKCEWFQELSVLP